MRILIITDSAEGMRLASARHNPKKNRVQRLNTLGLPMEMASRLKAALQQVRSEDVTDSRLAAERRRLQLETAALRRRLVRADPDYELVEER